MPENDDRRLLGTFMIVVAYGLAGIIWFFMYVNGVYPYWIVSGRVVDELGNPVEHARVTVSLDFDLDRSVTTDAEGNFLARIGVFEFWDQLGRPCIVAYKPGYREFVSCYQRWTWGPKFTRVAIRLQKGERTED